MAETPRGPGAPPEEYRQLYRSLTEKILDRAASDPTWKQRLLDDPEAAMRAANFPELERVEEMRAGAGEVRGHALPGSGAGGGVGDDTGWNIYTMTCRTCYCGWWTAYCY